MNQIIIDTTMNQMVKNLISYPKVDNSLKDTKLTLSFFWVGTMSEFLHVLWYILVLRQFLDMMDKYFMITSVQVFAILKNMLPRPWAFLMSRNLITFSISSLEKLFEVSVAPAFKLSEL